MTNKEAIEILKHAMKWEYQMDIVEAIDKALKCLEEAESASIKGWTFFTYHDVTREEIEERMKIHAIEYLIKQGYIKMTINDQLEPFDNGDGTISFYKKAEWKMMKPMRKLP